MQRPRWPPITWQRHVVVDVAIAFALVGFDVALIGGFGWPRQPPGYGWAVPWAGLAAQAVAAAALPLRRQRPVQVMAVTTAVSLAMAVTELATPGLLIAQPSDPCVPLAMPVAAYSVAAYAIDRRRVWSLVGLAAAVATRPWVPQWDLITTGLLVTAVPALLGLYVAARRRLVGALVERAERAEREQHLLAEQARADERTTLAGEMHDVVTHRVSLMVLQAGALRITAADDATRSAAEDLRVAGCQALSELRDLLGVLRGAAPIDDGESVGPAATSAPELSSLAAESESVGVPVALIEDGDPSRVSPVVARSLFRIAQEALTNARKHAPGAQVSVQVRYGADQVHLTIRNSAPARGHDTGLVSSGSGTGLLGLRRRVELVGGTLHAGPSPDGGFVVDAILPAYVPAPGVPPMRTAP